MPVDLRCKHDREVRVRAADLFDAGRGYESVARELSVPARTVRKWLATYRAVGREVLLDMGRSHARYSWETKVAAARAVVDGGRPKAEVMAEHGVASASPLDAWCRAYRGVPMLLSRGPMNRVGLFSHMCPGMRGCPAAPGGGDGHLWGRAVRRGRARRPSGRRR